MSAAIPIGLALAAAAMLLLRRKHKAPAGNTVTTTIAPLAMPDGGEVQRMRIEGATIPYLFRHATDTSQGLAQRTSRNWLRISGWIDFGQLPTTGSHVTLNLRNNVGLRNADLLPNGPSAPTLGHGVIFGVMGPGQPDFAADFSPRFCAVIEQFDKAQGMRILLPETASPALGQRVWCSVVSQRDGERMLLRYVVQCGAVGFDSGWVEIAHAAALDGDDFTRAMFPLTQVDVRYDPMECTWSDKPLEPVLPTLKESDHEPGEAA